ncbi:hypothetical protein [Ferruginibacter sp. SUN106]|uniref:hypothetical protein n=1 Tax=Ferruginibacter sp. SUN106 TaxID=2978348 RepID=UPI003D36F500
MDTKLIQQYGADILSYRLRTARQKKRMQYEDFDKQLIQLDKEETLLYRQQRNLGWEPLHPPVQKGWVRFFVLREDVARSRYATFFEGILNKINSYDYSWRKDFKKKKRRRGRKRYEVKPQYLLKPYEYEFVKMEFSEIEKTFFREVWELDWRKQPVKRYEFTEAWRFVLKVKPNMIDKVRIKDAELESKMSIIDNYLDRNDYRKRQCKLLRGYYKYKHWVKLEQYDEVDPYKNKSLLQILEIIKIN